MNQHSISPPGTLRSLLGLLKENVAKMILVSSPLYIIFVDLNQSGSTLHIDFRELGVLGGGTPLPYMTYKHSKKAEVSINLGFVSREG